MSNNGVVQNLQKRPPIPPRSKIPNRTNTPRPSTPPAILPLSVHSLSPKSRFGFKPSASSRPSSSPLSENTETTCNKSKSAIHKRSHGQQQRMEQEQQLHSNTSSHNKSSNNTGHKTSSSLSQPPISSLSVAELAAKFLHENVRNCIKPRIFPMENTSLPCERVPTPFVFTSETRIHHHHQRQMFKYTDKLLHNSSATSTTTTGIATAVFTRNRSSAAVTSSCVRLSMMNNCSSVGNSMSSSAVANGHNHHSHSRNNSLAKQSNSQNNRTDFASVLKKWNAPIPPVLSRKLGKGSESPLGKVKVMLRVCDNAEEASGGPGILGIDQRRKQVTLIDPGGSNGITPEERRVGVSAPKMFAFDGIFGEDDDQAEICAASAAELVASVLGGEDGCLISLGHCSPGKKQTMFGKPSNQKLGAVPTAISWLFKSIQEQKQKTGSRFSVRVSALEVTGGSVHEAITDLLAPFVNEGDQPPGAYLLDGSGNAVNGHKGSTSAKNVTSLVLNSVSEVRAPNPETAGFFLDSALDALNAREESGSGSSSGGHFVFTLHVYQYCIDKNGKGVVGGRSRLHCVLLGNGSPSISVLSGLLLAVLNGQRHLPSSNHSKLGAILRLCLGSLTCRAVVMIHISNSHSRYAESLAALQLGSRVHRLRRSRRIKMGSVGSGTGGSGGSSGGSGEEMRVLVTANQVGEAETGSSDIDPSSSEQSCDTVIYLGPSIDEATDGEHPPVYVPSLETTENGCTTKLLPSKCSSLTTSTSANGPAPKTKSPKPKSSNKTLSEGSFGSASPSSGVNGTGKSEEKWVDGPKVPKYRQLQNHLNQPSSPKKKGETWIDGPAARVNHQASNFPSPKKSVNTHSHHQKEKVMPACSVANGLSGDPCCMTSTKAEMIQKWICNQTHSPTFFGDISQLDDSFFGGHNNGCVFSGYQNGQQTGSAPCFVNQGDQHFNSFYPEPEYKALTVFKTCEDEETEEQEIGGEGYEFEFIEVVEPEVPVLTNDVCLQVTEEDIAQSFLEGENPLPESDQNFIMGSGSFFDRLKSSSFSDCPEQLYASSSSASFPTLDKSDHPLRVLSQECLTVVSTFADSMSVNGADLERFWQNNGFHEHENHEMCHGLCKNLVTLSQMSLDNLNDFHLHSVSPLQPNGHYSNQNSLQRKPPTGKIVAKDPPVINTDTVFKIPPTPNPRISSLTSHSRKSMAKDSSDAEQDTISIPPMELLDVNQIKNNCQTIENQMQSPKIPVKIPNHHHSCDHNHSHMNGGSVIGNLNGPNNGSILLNGNANSSTNGSSLSIHSSLSPSDAASPPQSLSPVVIPIQISETNGKSPSKSKSRKIARFFRSRSKSPKKVVAVATSSSESGKSSISSASDTKHSSSSSSCSSGVSIPGSGLSTCNSKKLQNSSPKHQSSPSKKQSLKVHPSFVSNNGTTDYHFTCDSALPMFLPNPNNAKVLSSFENGNVGINCESVEKFKSK